MDWYATARRTLLSLVIPFALSSPTYAEKPATRYLSERSYGSTVHTVEVAPPYCLEVAVSRAYGRTVMATSSLAKKVDSTIPVSAAINGGFYDPGSGSIIGTLISNDRFHVKERRYRAQIVIEHTSHGDKVRFGYFMGGAGIDGKAIATHLLTGGPYLLKDGKDISSASLAEEGFSWGRYDRHPRTAIGVKSDGTLVLMVNEGRRRGQSGMRLSELARYLQSKGCTDAINLDGGGSSTLVLKELGGLRVKNRPSDGGERAVPNGIVVYEKIKP